jgi:hypothetical protein
MSALAPTLQAFLSEPADYVDLGARCLVIVRVCVTSSA